MMSARVAPCPVRMVTAAELRAWAAAARPGERLVYLTAPAMVQGPAARAAASLYRDGLVDLGSARRADCAQAAGRPCGRCFDWFVERIGRPGRRDRRSLAVRDAAAAKILAALRRAAEGARPCPSDAQLARIAGLATRGQAAWRVRKLEAERRIACETMTGADGQAWRVVTILSNGNRTAEPRGAGAAQAA